MDENEIKSNEPDWKAEYQKLAAEVKTCHQEIMELRYIVRSLSVLLTNNHTITV